MIDINIDNLNVLEKQIYNTLMEYSKSNSKFRINTAAELCNCSVSKISKFVKKLGFANFKQYLEFLYDEYTPVSIDSEELIRIKGFIDNFDLTMKDDFYNLIQSFEKIVLFGYGPSLICAQYFEYRLRTCSNKTVMALSDEISVTSMVDEKTLLVILTVSGKFHSFETVYQNARSKGCTVTIVAEEYNTTLFDQCDRIFLLSKVSQPNHLKPYEKSRTIFFIFLEEIIIQLQNDNYEIEQQTVCKSNNS